MYVHVISMQQKVMDLDYTTSSRMTLLRQSRPMDSRLKFFRAQQLLETNLVQNYLSFLLGAVVVVLVMVFDQEKLLHFTMIFKKDPN